MNLNSPVAPVAAVKSVLRPRSVVVIGASPHGRGFTSAPIKNLTRHGFAGDVYAVNPKYDEIDGVPCFGSVAEIPTAPDTAVIVVGAERVPAALADCASSGVASATVIAGGFAELGARGVALQEEVRAICAETGLRLVGPNTAGLMNVVDSYVPRAGLNHPEHLTPGSVAIATQSGALCNTLLNRVLAYGRGISMAVATGSQWDLGLWDFVDYFISDARTKAILTIPEGIHDVAKFVSAARRAVEGGKPIILLKPGRSEVGSKAIQTHSGALAGAADVQISILRDHGVIVVDDLDELWETGHLFNSWPVDSMPSAVSGRLGVLTYSGGDGALAVDAAEEAGLSCPEPTPATVAALDGLFQLATPGNPFDYTGEVVAKPELITPATEAFVNDEAFDVALIAAPVWSGHFAKWIVGPAVEAAAASRRPTAVSLWSAGELTTEAQEVVHASGLPLFDGSPRAVGAIGRYVEFLRARRRLLAMDSRPPAASPRRRGQIRMLNYWESRGLLDRSGLAFNQACAVDDVDAAVDAAEEIGFPVTLKVSAELAIHKVSSGGVRLFVPDVVSLRKDATEMLDTFPAGRLIVEQFIPGVSMALVGGHCDPEFGPVIVFGLGGGYAEAYRDVSHLQCPASAEQVAAALARTKFGRMLSEDSEAFGKLVDAVATASRWFAETPDVHSFDVNPILVGLDGALVAVDARVEIFA
jgi:acyl-CoA synthetase (NDP forming)